MTLDFLAPFLHVFGVLDDLKLAGFDLVEFLLFLPQFAHFSYLFSFGDLALLKFLDLLSEFLGLLCPLLPLLPTDLRSPADIHLNLSPRGVLPRPAALVHTNSILSILRLDILRFWKLLVLHQLSNIINILINITIKLW